MQTAKLTFQKCIQDSDEFGSNDEYMVSRVFFTICVGKHDFPDLYADVKQPVRSKIKEARLEVGKPEGYSGPLNYESYVKAMEEYYRGTFGKRESVIQTIASSQMRIKNNVVEKKKVVEFKIGGSDSCW